MIVFFMNCVYIAFHQRKAPKISFVDWNKYLDEIATAKKMNVNTIKTKLVECGEPGFTGGTVIFANLEDLY